FDAAPAALRERPSRLQDIAALAVVKELLARDAALSDIVNFVDTYRYAQDTEQETQMAFKNPNDAYAEPQGEHTEGFEEDDVATDDSHAARLHALLSEHCPPEVMAQIGEILASIAGEAEEGEEDVEEAETGEDEDLDHAKAGGIDYKTVKRRDALQRQVNP